MTGKQRQPPFSATALLTTVNRNVASAYVNSVPNASHEGVKSREAALEKYAQARLKGLVLAIRTADDGNV